MRLDRSQRTERVGAHLQCQYAIEATTDGQSWHKHALFCGANSRDQPAFPRLPISAALACRLAMRVIAATLSHLYESRSAFLAIVNWLFLRNDF